jgi:hypothetical protein
MSDRNKPHNGRSVTGEFKVRQVDVDELLEDPKGAEYLQDDVRLGGAVEDVGMNASQSGERISRMIEDNRFDVDHATGRDRQQGSQSGRHRRRRR